LPRGRSSSRNGGDLHGERAPQPDADKPEASPDGLDQQSGAGACRVLGIGSWNAQRVILWPSPRRLAWPTIAGFSWSRHTDELVNLATLLALRSKQWSDAVGCEGNTFFKACIQIARHHVPHGNGWWRRTRFELLPQVAANGHGHLQPANQGRGEI